MQTERRTPPSTRVDPSTSTASALPPSRRTNTVTGRSLRSERTIVGATATAGQKFWGVVVAVGVLVQVFAGAVNIMLSAPGWMQLVHLMLG